MVIARLCIILEYFFKSFEVLHQLYVEIITIKMIITWLFSISWESKPHDYYNKIIFRAYTSYTIIYKRDRIGDVMVSLNMVDRWFESRSS